MRGMRGGGLLPAPHTQLGESLMIMQSSQELLPLRNNLNVWLLVICFLFIQAGCTQDNNPPTGALTANDSPSASLNEKSAKATPHLPDDKNDRSKTGIQNPSDFSLIMGETDGDGFLEEISVCEVNKICVATFETGSKRMYENGTWHTVDLIAVQDTDGEAGAEIVTVAYTREGQLACVCIIHDKAKSIEFYRGQRWSSAKVEALEDTDGIGGAEVLVQIRADDGKLQCLCLIRDRDRTVREYSDVAWTTVQIKAVTDTDGESGKEVVFESRNLDNEVLCVCVIRDRKDELAIYTDSQWQTGEVSLLMDTDGKPGLEIIVTFTRVSDSGITIIHDVSRTSKTYRFTGKHTIQQVRNYDQSQGDEICVILPTLEKFVLITDRAQEQEVVESCEEPMSSPARS